MARIQERMEADEFYNKVRPFLNGWTEGALKEGVEFRGSSATSGRFRLSGGSAAQSTTIQVLDALLGIKHTGESGAFLLRMRQHMPRIHRAYLERVERRRSARTFIEDNSCSHPSSEAYNACVDALVDFRSYHIQLVSRFIVQPAARATREDVDAALKTHGTGGTPVMQFIKGVRDSTKTQKFS